MTPAETDLLRAFLGSSDSVVEFGSGGSTVLAAGLVARQVITLDSDQAWLLRVRDACAAARTRLSPVLLHVDIGPTAEWGHPAGDGARASWPAYHGSVWQRRPDARAADLFLVDGRFRVACFLRTLLEATHDPLVAIHDFGIRPQYDPIRDFARQVCATGTLAVFRRRPGFDAAAASACLRAHEHDPS